MSRSELAQTQFLMDRRIKVWQLEADILAIAELERANNPAQLKQLLDLKLKRNRLYSDRARWLQVAERRKLKLADIIPYLYPFTEYYKRYTGNPKKRRGKGESFGI